MGGIRCRHGDNRRGRVRREFLPARIGQSVRASRQCRSGCPHVRRNLRRAGFHHRLGTNRNHRRSGQSDGAEDSLNAHGTNLGELSTAVSKGVFEKSREAILFDNELHRPDTLPIKHFSLLLSTRRSRHVAKTRAVSYNFCREVLIAYQSPIGGPQGQFRLPQCHRLSVTRREGRSTAEHLASI